MVGAKVVEISLPTTKLCLPSYYIIACAEASSNLSRYDGVRFGHRATYPADATTSLPSATLHDLYSRTRSEGFGKEVQVPPSYKMSRWTIITLHSRGVFYWVRMCFLPRFFFSPSSEFFELVRSCEFAANARRFDDAGCRMGACFG